MQFFLACIPPKVSHHAKKIVRAGKFTKLADKLELVNARGELVALLQPHHPVRPFDEPLALWLTFIWPYNTSDPKSTRQENRRIMHAVKPDCDNLAKTFIDCMVRCGFMVNDSRIVRLSVEKYRWAKPGIFVRLEDRYGYRGIVGMDYSDPATRAVVRAGLAQGFSDRTHQGGGEGSGGEGSVSPDGRGSGGGEGGEEPL